MATSVTEPDLTKEKTPRHQQSQQNSAGVVVLQWLTYAFWGWLILGLIWLMSVILITAIVGSSVNEVVPYAIAASVVLLPLAFVCDFFYRKYEPIKKTGAAMVIMVIHAVLFALLGIGTLIVAVFTTLNMAINIEGNVNAQIVTALTVGFATLLYAGAFVRTLHPFKNKKLASVYSFSMLALTIVLLILAIVGPVIRSIATRDDRSIESNLPSLQRSIDEYITENKALPTSLSSVTIDDEGAQMLVDQNKVKYVPDGKTTITTGAYPQDSFKYQLCVDYKAPAYSRYGGHAGYGSSYTDTGGGYKTYLSTYAHEAGNVCYKLERVLSANAYNE
jgi:type II secretory pathway pseudopilin PulG